MKGSSPISKLKIGVSPRLYGNCPISFFSSVGGCNKIQNGFTKHFWNNPEYFSFSLLQNEQKILLTLGRCLLKDSSLSMPYWERCPKTLLSKVNTTKIHNKITDPSSLGTLVAIFSRLIQSFSSTLCSHTYEPQYIYINKPLMYYIKIF